MAAKVISFYGSYDDPADEFPPEPYQVELRLRRERANLTQEELAKLVCRSPSLISHWESGRRKPTLEDARLLDQVLNTGGVFERFLERDPYAGHFDRAAHAERKAIRIEEYTPVYMPGLLQTEAYARALFRTNHEYQTPEELDRRVVNRLRRARILTESRVTVSFIVAEAVLRYWVGGPTVMADQIDHAIGLVKQERVKVQVVPFSEGAHGVMGSLVSLMYFDDGPPVAYAEAVNTGHLMCDSEMVEQHRAMYDQTRGAALSLGRSLHLMETVAKEYRSYGHIALRPEPGTLAQVQLQPKQ
ncbi:helix-turn-helix transcriptional regulator [Streptomyces sp. JJ66]|uniref:helix-turn-helix domain-containing protein n=1 Tax=Streptomyces sp. JJ66 TaxID=2803843 RepID=UPI001C5A09B7|nr:helix-turn-helix transcriptional regulator [Streptomyces sp. JJ66]MBW1602678.1 helix-turn-helix transcriptional regulator [Streptomyces sp. JJ66]